MLLFADAAPAAYFGKNKVHDRALQWEVIETAHFRIHFYDAERELALETVSLAEAIYTDLSARLDHDIPRPIPLVVYSSHPEFQRTNISTGWINEGTGGVTEFLKRRVYLPYPGSREEYRHVLQHELVHAFQIDILAPSGSMRELGRIRVPLWMIEGMAEYLSLGGEGAFTTLWIRDALLDGPLPSFTSLARYRDVRIYRFGQSAWAYLAEVYGDRTPGDFLRELARSADAEEAIRIVFGKDGVELSDEWRDSMRKGHYEELAGLDRVETVARQVAGGGALHVAPAVSPSGETLAYLSDRAGSFSLYRCDRNGGEIRRLIEGGAVSGAESLRPFHGRAAWSPDERRLLIPAQKGSETVLILMDMESGDVIRTFSLGIEEVRGVSWGPGGDRVIVSAIRGGRSDLYLLDMESGSLSAITEDRFVYIHPDWSPDGQLIVCATDRVTEGAAPGRDRLLRLGFLDLASDSWFIPLDQGGNNHSPAWDGRGEWVAFVSDRAGAPDIYLRKIDYGSTERVSSFEGGVCGLVPDSPSLTWSGESSELYFSYFRNRTWSIHSMNDPRGVDRESEELDRLAQAPPPSAARVLHPRGYVPPYRIRPYKPGLSLDQASAGGSAVTEGGLYSGSAISFSDLLGNHRLHLMFGVYGSLGSSDLYVSYEDLSRMTEWEIAAFQFRREGRDIYGRSSVSALYRGMSLGIRRPIDRFRRLEWGIRIGEADEYESTETVNFIGLNGAAVLDNVRWAYYGARKGERIRLSVEPLMTEEWGMWLLGDFRFYREAADRVVVAGRSLAGWLAGDHVPAFRVAPRFVIRGFYESSWEERSYLAQSFELRFPLLDFVKLGWPFAISLGGIRGTLFADAGWFPDAGSGSKTRMAYGPGLRTGFGPFQLMLDFPQKVNESGRIGRMKGFFQIGREF